MSRLKKSNPQLTPKIWGGTESPLLPRVLRRLWCSEAMPLWICEMARLPRGSTYQALDAHLSGTLDVVSRVRIQNFTTALLRARFDTLRDLRALSEIRWNPVAEATWSGRTRSAILKTDFLSDTSALAALTFEQLSRVPGMGVRTMLDFLCTLEAHTNQSEEKFVLGEQLELIPDIEKYLTKLRAASKNAWAEVVSEGDLRFKGIFPRGAGTFADRVEQLLENRDFDSAAALAEASEKISVVAEEIERLPLEDLLSEILQKFINLSERHIDALLRRLGWLGEAPITLAEAGDRIGITRERIRQLEAKFTRSIPAEGLYAPAVAAAVKIITEASPIAVSRVSALLIDSGVTYKSFSPESVISAATVLGIEHNLEIQAGGGGFVYAGAQAASPKKIIAMARRMSGSSGAVKLSDLCERLTTEGLSTRVEDAATVLHETSKARFLSEDWVWFPDGPVKRSRLRNMTRRMLSVVSPIHVSKLRDGVKREAFYLNSVKDGWPITIPPENILRVYYTEHREFTISEDGMVGCVEPLDYRTELVGVDQVLIDVIRSVPTGVLDRSSFREASIRRGISAASFDQALTYSAIIERIDNNIWSARGLQLDPSAVAACREANARRPQERRITDFGWTSAGEIWFSAVVSSHQNMVLGVPKEVRRFLAEGRFSEAGQTGVTIGVSKDGTSYGYGPILRRLGAEEGDLIIAIFDLVKATVTVRIGGLELGDDD